MGPELAFSLGLCTFVALVELRCRCYIFLSLYVYCVSLLYVSISSGYLVFSPVKFLELRVEITILNDLERNILFNTE